MADPPARVPEPPPTNRRGSTAIPALENLGLSTAPRTRRQTRHGDDHSNTVNPGDNNGRVTTKEIRQLIDNLKEIIHHQTTLIESTKAELQEIKHNQNVLQTQNEKLHKEIQALRAQIGALPSTPPARSWAAVAASGSHLHSQPNHQCTDKDQNCVRISTQRSFVDPRDNVDSDKNAFGRYLPTEAVNTHIRTALSSAPSTQDTQVAGVSTTKTGYVIRFKNIESAEAARNNTEWLNRLGNNTKVVKPQFGVVIHCTPTEDFDLESASAQAIEKIIEENELTEQGFQIEEIA